MEKLLVLPDQETIIGSLSESIVKWICKTTWAFEETFYVPLTKSATEQKFLNISTSKHSQKFVVSYWVPSSRRTKGKSNYEKNLADKYLAQKHYYVQIYYSRMVTKKHTTNPA